MKIFKWLLALLAVASVAQAKDFSKFGFARIRAVSPKLAVTKPEINQKIIENEMAKAQADSVSLLTFTELGITGYTAEDYFLNSELLRRSRQAIEGLVEFSANSAPDVMTIVGAPWQLPDGRLYNAAVVIYKGKVAGVVPKVHLPNYGEFYERRWFESGAGVELGIKDASLGNFIFGTDQIFVIGDMRVAIEVCEDAWAVIPPSSLHALAGANVIVNLSASNELVGKADFRRKLVTFLSSQQIGAYVYASSGPWESSRDLVFGGHTLIAENGELIKEGKRFQFDGAQITADIDLDKISIERRRNRSFGSQRPQGDHHVLTLGAYLRELKSLNRLIAPHPFWSDDAAEMDERMKEVFDIQVTGLVRRLLATKSEKVVIGVSGGSDSTLALLVAVEALTRMGRPASDILAVTMPGFGTSSRTKDQAYRLMNALGVEIREIPIVNSVKQHFQDIGHKEDVHDVTYENSQARERTQILFDLANQVNGMVLGTGDLSELCLGWCTYNADQMSHYNVNGSVPKGLVKFVIGYCLKKAADPNLKQVLEDILGTEISPELLPLSQDGQIAQKSEDAFGPYEVVDFAVSHFFRSHFSWPKILALAEIAFGDKYSSTELKTWLEEISRRFANQRFKTTAMPPGPKVGSASISPRDARYPDDVIGDCRQLLDF